MSATDTSARRPVDPRRYFESASEARGDAAPQNPVCLYLETTNRCNLLCTTCPRTYEELEPPADMSWALFTPNGTLLNEKNGRALIDAGLDELRVSLDAATAKSYKAIRGKDFFARILRNVRAFR